ncbi:MAG: DNA polymerase III subunit alpha [Acholeplasma sp.]|nr:DNA polymerase III subunit alpha [Acholeplasma sp.]
MIGLINLQTEYSLQNSTIRLESVVNSVIEAGYDTIFISDDNNLYGAYKFFKLTKNKINAILGMRIKVMNDELSFINAYVLNQTGYQNLVVISSLINLSKEKHIDLSDLAKYQEGLVFITSGYESDINHALHKNDHQKAQTLIQNYKNKLSKFYLGLSLQTLKEEMVIAPLLIKLGYENGVKLLPVHKTCYMPEEAFAYDALIKIDNSSNIRFDDADLSFKTKKELMDLFSEYPFVFDHLNEAFKGADFSFEFEPFKLPKVNEDPSFDSKAYLTDLCIIGLNRRFKIEGLTNLRTYRNRLKYELDVIDKMGYNDYFLVVWDFVKYAKSNDIMVGPGRGSAAGSLVSYCLGITNVDPIQYGLLFERFLNPERISMPDIDLDFPDNRRDEVIQYVAQKYGKKRVVSITTFQTLQVKSSIRDICRTQNLSVAETNKIVKQATSAYEITDLKTLELLELAKQIEGLPRQTGTHAAGIILSNEDLSRIIPFQEGASSLYQSQFEASDLESLGLLKIDFLGIRNLSIIQEVLKMLALRGIMVDINKIPFEDNKTYQLLSRADTQGVFQLESPGMRRVLTKLKPSNFEDLVALLALFRPGPMDNIDVYIERRNGKKYDYIDPSLEQILKPTFGIIIYQEQIMQIASTFANYSLAEADLLRRGVSKKNHDILENERKKFVSKAISNGKTKALSEKIYDYIVKFADYGFNRSHSVAYAVIAYQMAYLKANYFDAFMTVLLSSVASNVDQVAQYIQQLQKANIKVLPPDVNQSDFTFKWTENGIIYPLVSIKNVGTQTVIKIKEEREKSQFKDYDDFKNRLRSELSERVLEALIFSGALDGFGLNKKTLFEKRNNTVKAYELFVSDILDQSYQEYDLKTLIEKEKQVLGFNLCMTPIIAYQSYIDEHHITRLSDLSRKSTKTIGLIKKMTEITTKTGHLMAFVELYDGQTSMELTMFSTTYEKYKSIMDTSSVYVFEVRSNDYDGLKFIVSNMEKLS